MRVKNAFAAVLCVLGLLTPSAGSAENAPQSAQRLPWGAGVYGSPGNVANLLDTARWDWVACHSGDSGPEGVRGANRLLEINPRQKYQFQLTGNLFYNGLPENGSVMNFLDYHFDANRRASFDKALREQARGIVQGLHKPENIAAFTFYEEVPGSWGYCHLLRPAVMRLDGNNKPRAPEDVNRGTSAQDKRVPFPDFLKPYQKQIEQERGKPLTWNEETWRYLGDMYASTINDIHRAIKEASGGMPVYYWLHNGMATLDTLPKDWTFDTATGTECAYRLSDIIRPGLCEGVMVYPSTVQRWEQLRSLFEKHRHWKYFAQLWHPGAFRLDTWDATVARTIAPNPWNQGYFFYCEGGGCARVSGWNDPEMGKAEATFKDRFVVPVRDAQEGPAMRIAPSSLKVTALNHQYLSDVHPTVQLQGGKKYRWSVRLKTRDITAQPANAGSPASKQGAVMFVRWFNSSAQIGEDWMCAVVGTHDWQTYSGVVAAPAGAVGYCVFVTVWHATGEALFTKISLKAEGDDQELIGNGNFEKFVANPLKFDHWYHVDSSLTLAHWRHFCNKHRVGDDVVARYFKLAVEFEKPQASLEAGKPFPLAARLTNTRDASYYEKSESATANHIIAALTLPPGMKL
ncbi:MAG: hypothetical protein ABIK89_03675, partial [Planctomycetota bacterium]